MGRNNHPMHLISPPKLKFSFSNPVPWIPAAVLMALSAVGPAWGAGVEQAPRDSWPSFRGTPSLSAYSAATVPDVAHLKWSFKTGGPVKSTPAVAGGMVYFGSEDEKVYAVRLSDGTKVWEVKTDGLVVSSPLLLDGRIYIGTAGTNLLALDAAKGTEVWRYGTEGEVKSSAGWFRSPKGDANWLVIGGYDNRLHCVDAATGKSNWVYETGNFVNGAPAVGGGLTAFGGCDAIVHVLNLADGTKAREVEAGAYIIGSAAVVDGVGYVGHYENEFLAIDLRKGEVKWRYRDRNFPYGGSPAVTRDRVLFGGRDKRVHCVDRETGRQVWVFATRGKVESSPVVAGDRVVVGSDDGRVYVLGLADGKEIWNHDIGQAVQGSPAVVDDHILVGAEDGVLYCFGRKAR